MGFSSRVDEAENQISNLEYKEAKNTQSEQQKEKESPPKKCGYSTESLGNFQAC